MSYRDHAGTAELSHSQIDRVRQLIVERSLRYLNARVIQPVNCTALLRTPAASEARLIELKDERDGETDLVIRRRLGAAVVRLQRDIAAQRSIARSNGCI